MPPLVTMTEEVELSRQEPFGELGEVEEESHDEGEKHEVHVGLKRRERVARVEEVPMSDGHQSVCRIKYLNKNSKIVIFRAVKPLRCRDVQCKEIERTSERDIEDLPERSTVETVEETR